MKTPITTIVFSGLLAIALWAYVSLKSSVTVFMQFPMTLQLPEDISPSGSYPQSISVKVRATGWQLLNMRYFGAQPQCVVDISKQKTTSTEMRLIASKNEILEGLGASLSLDRVVEISPESFSLPVAAKMRKKIPVIPVATVRTARGYGLVGSIAVQPDSVLVAGADYIVSSLNSWKTQPVAIENIRQNFTVSAPLSDSLKDFLQRSTSSALLSGKVEETAEITLYDVGVEITGENGDKRLKEQYVAPMKVNLLVRGSVQNLAKLTSAAAKVELEAKRLIQNTSGSVRPTIVLPPNIQLLAVDPPFLVHRIRRLFVSAAQ